MSVSVMIECPHCHAQGNLADPALFGQSISCPVCQKTFTAPVPANSEPAASVPVVTASATPSPDPVEANPSAAPTMASPIPAATAFPDSQLAPPVSPTADTAIATAASMPMVIPTVVAQPSGAPAPAGFAAVSPEQLAQMPGMLVAVAVSTEPAQPVPAVPVQPPAPVWPMAVPGPAVPPPVVTGDFLMGERAPMEGPMPAFMAPAPAPGAAEESFAQSLPEPEVRGAVKPPKQQSKQMQYMIYGSITVIVLFATIMFLAGDPFRGRAPKKQKPVEVESHPAQQDGPQESMEDLLKRIQNSNKN